MQKVWKKYYQLGNLIVRLSSHDPASKKNAILVNSHLDSTLPSPGAADDGAGVVVSLEALRVLAGSPQELSNAVVFLFNGGEESLQDASHLFITQHELKNTLVYICSLGTCTESRRIRTVINVEACGTAGKEIVFQATNEQVCRLSTTADTGTDSPDRSFALTHMSHIRMARF